MKMEELLKAMFSTPKKSVVPTKHSPVNAKRKKARSPLQLVNYITGNGLIDWLTRHPDKVNVKFAPVKFKITYKSTRESFIDELEVALRLFNLKNKLKYKVLTPSDYGCDTILAMRDKYDVIFNATLVDRPGGRISKVDVLVRSHVINRVFKTMYTDNHGCQFSTGGTSWHYVPMCYVDNQDKTVGSKTVAEMNIAIAVSVLAKYQKYQPDLGYTLEGGSGTPILAGAYRPANYTLIQEGIDWLDFVDKTTRMDESEDDADDESFKDEPVGANAKISCTSPWCSAVKYMALEQEHITMLPKSKPTMSCINWQSLDESDNQREWVENYYSETGHNMGKFKKYMNSGIPIRFVSISEIDGVPYQATVLNASTGESTYIVASPSLTGTSTEVVDWLKKELAGTPDDSIWAWGLNPYVIGLTGLDIQDLRSFCEKNSIKFPFTANYDLDFIGYRALPETMHKEIPVVAFSLDEVTREYYYGAPDSKTRKELLQYMKQASLLNPKILYLLGKHFGGDLP